MKRFKDKLSIRVTFYVMIITLFVLGGFTWYRNNTLADDLNEQLRGELNTITTILSESLSIPLYNFNKESLKTISLSSFTNKEVMSIKVYHSELQEDWLAMSRRGDDIVEEEINFNNQEILKQNQPITVFGNVIGVVEVVISKSFLKETLKIRIREMVIQILILEIVLVVLLLSILRILFINPIKEITKISSKIASGNLNERLNIRRGYEFRKLSGTINIMQKSLKNNINSLHKEIDNRRKAEKKYKKEKHKAEEASKAKSQFLANMSHEIRTPMNGVIGMTELLQMTDLTPEQEKYVNAIDLSADNLLEIINNILDISKIEAGRIELEIKENNLYNVIYEIINVEKYKANKKGLELVVDIDKEVPKFLKFDKGKVTQILLNLINNAIKFTNEGDILIRIDKISGRAKKVELEFKVRDTGIGISQEKLKRIFLPFEQGDLSYTKKYQGTGLGLGISKRLVDIMGGEIYCSSKKGEGSTFSFKLVLEKGTKNLKNIEMLDLDIKNLKILFIDDNELNREITKAILEEKKAKVYTTGKAREGIEIIEEENIDIVLLDMHMPDVNGFDTAKLIRKRYGIEQKIILFSSVDVRSEITKMKKIGIRDYLIKPVKKEELLKKIKEVLNREIGEDIEMDLEEINNFKIEKSKEKVMIVEDNELNMETLVAIVNRYEGYKIIKAYNGKEAVNKYKKDTPKYIFMDIQMPKMNGIEAFELIKKEADKMNKEVVVSAVTAYARKKEKDKILEAGIDNYISKPYKPKSIEDFLKNN